MGFFDKAFSGSKGAHIFSGVDSIVGEHAKFKGEISSKGSLNINGEFEGKISSDGEVIVSPGGKVVGEINGGTVIIAGRVDGNIAARETLEVSRSGKVHGDLTGGKIVIEDGASYQGRVKVESGPSEVTEEPLAEVPQTTAEAFPNF